MTHNEKRCEHGCCSDVYEEPAPMRGAELWHWLKQGCTNIGDEHHNNFEDGSEFHRALEQLLMTQFAVELRTCGCGQEFVPLEPRQVRCRLRCDGEEHSIASNTDGKMAVAHIGDYVTYTPDRGATHHRGWFIWRFTAMRVVIKRDDETLTVSPNSIWNPTERR